MNLGDLTKEYRKRHGMNMQTFADLCGLSKAYISILERNYNPKSGKPPVPSLETIRAISAVMGKDFNDVIALLDGDQEVTLSDLPSSSPSVLPVDFSHLKRIPILGHIAAGLPLYAEEQIEGYTFTDLNGGAEYFALRVEGDSMNAIGINDGYLIIVRRQDAVENGEVAVVMVADENATVKRFYAGEGTVTLVPQSTNPIHQPQIYDLSKISIKVLGKVIKVEFSI